MLIERHLANLAATRALGERLGRALRPGDFVGISGPLGAGKTALVQAIASGAGVATGEASSPTFTLIHRYRGSTVELYHADFFRIGTQQELHDIGFFELVGSQGAVLVEWIDRFPGAAADEWLELRLTPEGSPGRSPEGGLEARRLEAVGHGRRGESLLGCV